MKRVLLWALAVVMTGLGTVPVSASVNSFRFSNFTADYYLSRDNEGRSTLKTVETLVAQFPEIDQDHGIERAIPKAYDEHSVSLSVESVKKADGSAWNYSTYEQDGLEVLRIGDADRYVHGEQTYIITYTQRDVTKYFSNTGSDEWYWDINGTAWQQPFDAVQATIHVDESLRAQLNGNIACYRGVYGSTKQCSLFGSDGEYSLEENNIGTGENVTVAIGFKPSTFGAYQQSLAEKATGLSLLLNFTLGPIALIAGWIWLVVKNRSYAHPPEVKHIEQLPVIAEYLPPPGRSVVESSVVYRNSVTGVGTTGQLIDWAVRHFVQIEQTKEKSLLSAAEYRIRVMKPFDTLSTVEQRVAMAIFGHMPTVDETITTTELQKRASTITQEVSKQTGAIRSGDLYTKNVEAAHAFRRFAGYAVLVGLLALVCVPFGVLAIVALIYSTITTYKNAAGAQLKKYLDGLKLYIGVAETDRIAMLQSPEGAAKVGDVSDTGARIKLYERVLPYAILFGQEKEWTKQLGTLYEQTQSTPTWYASNNAFNAAVFSSSLSSFSGALASATNYSSSGGSGGGGFSGGGGGGGGGGGW